ncbi:MAG: hypothetical protein HZA52_06065 [Planctomycetes bacterium]|nr:hypothetical protein [Planctomycetota bacterium]
MTALRSRARLAPIAILGSPGSARCSVDRLVDPVGGFVEPLRDRFVLANDERFTGAPNHDDPLGEEPDAVLRWVESGDAGCDLTDGLRVVGFDRNGPVEGRRRSCDPSRARLTSRGSGQRDALAPGFRGARRRRASDRSSHRPRGSDASKE